MAFRFFACSSQAEALQKGVMMADLTKRYQIRQKTVELLSAEFPDNPESIDLVELLRQWASGMISGLPHHNPPMDPSRREGVFPGASH